MNHNVISIAQESAETPPTMTPLTDVTVDEGAPAQFRTQVTGNPTIQWFREGALIPQTEDFAVSVTRPFNLSSN